LKGQRAAVVGVGPVGLRHGDVAARYN